jgi:hypothetical protein
VIILAGFHLELLTLLDRALVDRQILGVAELGAAERALQPVVDLLRFGGVRIDDRDVFYRRHGSVLLGDHVMNGLTMIRANGSLG